MSEDAKKIKETFEEYRRRTSSSRWAIRMEFSLLHSPAYKSLSYGPALKALPWCYEKGRNVETNRKKRGDKRYIVTLVDFSFTYEEAKLRGLDHKKFYRALCELVRYGFLDVVHRGSGNNKGQKDFSLYRLSERWRDYDTDRWVAVEMEKAACYVARDEKTKRWIGRPKGKSQRPISAVHQRPITAVQDVVERPISAVENTEINEISTANNSRILSTTRVCTASDGDALGLKVEEKGLKSNCAASHSDDAAPSIPPPNGEAKTTRLTKADLLEKITAALEHQFTIPKREERPLAKRIAEQLDDIQRGRLDPEKVRAGLLASIPESVVRDLLSIVGVNGVKPKIRIARPKVVYSRRATPEEIASVAAWT